MTALSRCSGTLGTHQLTTLFARNNPVRNCFASRLWRPKADTIERKSVQKFATFSAADVHVLRDLDTHVRCPLSLPIPVPRSVCSAPVLDLASAEMFSVSVADLKSHSNTHSSTFSASHALCHPAAVRSAEVGRCCG